MTLNEIQQNAVWDALNAVKSKTIETCAQDEMGAILKGLMDIRNECVRAAITVRAVSDEARADALARIPQAIPTFP